MFHSKYFTLLQLMNNERRSLDELINYQTIRLKKLLLYSYNNVPFYKKLFDNSGFHPSDFKIIEDITKVPVIDKQLLAQKPYEDLISKKFRVENLLTVKTAGSNGSPYMFYINKSYDQFRKSQFLRPYLTNGKRLSDHTISFSVTKTAKKKWFQNFGVFPETRIYSAADVSIQIEKIKKIKPQIIQGYGSVLNLLSIKILDEKIEIPKPRLIFTDSELLIPEMRNNIEEAFSAKVIDIYGTFETDNIAYECSSHEGYHIAADCVIMEFLKNGSPANPDDEGEIVVTVLNNFGMPFIRYNLHDMGSYSNKKCSCGRTFPLMHQLKGRSNDYILAEDGRKFSLFNLGRFASLAPNVYEYQIIQEDYNQFTLLVVPNTSYDNEGEKMIAPAIKELFPKAEVDIKLVSFIKREPSGKFKSFKSKIKTSNQNI